jgi:hypothetical protein
MAHHRRFVYTLPPLLDLGMVSNAARHAFDLVDGDPSRLADAPNILFGNHIILRDASGA